MLPCLNVASASCGPCRRGAYREVDTLLACRFGSSLCVDTMPIVVPLIECPASDESTVSRRVWALITHFTLRPQIDVRTTGV